MTPTTPSPISGDTREAHLEKLMSALDVFIAKQDEEWRHTNRDLTMAFVGVVFSKDTAPATGSAPVAIYQKSVDSNLGIWKDISEKEYDVRLDSKRIVYADSRSAPEVRIHTMWSSGGCTGFNDYLMTDYSIRTLKASDLVKGQVFPPNDGSYETVLATNPHAESLTAKLAAPASPATSGLTGDWLKYRTIAVCVAQKLGGKAFAEAMRLQFDKAKPSLAASTSGDPT